MRLLESFPHPRGDVPRNVRELRGDHPEWSAAPAGSMMGVSPMRESLQKVKEMMNDPRRQEKPSTNQMMGR